MKENQRDPVRLTTQIANFFAKYSTAKWNSCRFLRVVCRTAYRSMGEIAIFHQQLQQHREQRLFPPMLQKLINDSTSGLATNYPWPYSDPNFANWAEENDTLITDPANFVIRRSTSYIAWKIREATGHWPKYRAKARYDAKDWGEFLTLNGFSKVEKPHGQGLYVGVNPTCGEFGQLYWLVIPSTMPNNPPYACTSYIDFHPTYYHLSPNDPNVTWYQCSAKTL